MYYGVATEGLSMEMLQSKFYSEIYAKTAVLSNSHNLTF